MGGLSGIRYALILFIPLVLASFIEEFLFSENSIHGDEMPTAYKWLQPVLYLKKRKWDTVESEFCFVVLTADEYNNNMESELVLDGELIYIHNGYYVFIYDKNLFIQKYRQELSIR